MPERRCRQRRKQSSPEPGRSPTVKRQYNQPRTTVHENRTNTPPKIWFVGVLNSQL